MALGAGIVILEGNAPGQRTNVADERRPVSIPPTRASRSASRSASMARAKRKQPRRGWRRFFSWKWILLVLLGFFLLGVAGFAVAYASTDVPEPNDLANAQASVVYYSDGKTEMDRFSVVNRESVPLAKIPLHVQRALLAAEDRSFYQNNGVSPSGIARAVLVAVRGGPTQGGSTITQQYVKNYFLTQDRTISRKLKEFIISIKIDQQESKNTILENYLNTIYYGRGASGIQTAARAYFHVDASRLNVAQGALLASVIRGPAFYDPALGPEQTAAATARVKYVLDGMVAQGWLSPAERAKTVFPKVYPPVKKTKAGPVGYITDEVRRELTNKLGLTDTDIDRGGLRIQTTINKAAQAAAVKAVAGNVPSEKEAPHLRVGLTAIRPGDGAIVAMYGGKDFSTRQLNNATQATMQAGSTFKVFGLLAALQKDISTKTRFDGHSPQYFPEFKGGENSTGKVKNFGQGSGEQFGMIDLRRALAHSVNTVFAQLNIKLADGGRDATGVRDAAILAGLPAKGIGTDMANIFGTASVRVIDMANAYATVAAQGQKATPYLVSKVTSANGSVDYKVKKKLTPAFDKKVAIDVTDAMTRVITEGTGSGARALGRPAAGKTGTTSDNLAVWFDGFTPQLSAAVGIYQGNALGVNEGTKTIKLKSGREVTGAGMPVDIWAAFMEGALKGQKVIDFPTREGVGDSSLPTPTTTATTTTTAPTTPATPPTTVTTSVPPATKEPGPPTVPGPPTTVP